jgi:hypothetical protein
MSLDARDYAILGPLPLSPRTLLAGKLLALAMFVSTVAVAVNLVPTVFFPFILLTSSAANLSVFLFPVLMVSHGVACMAAALFGFLAIVSLRGVLVTVLGPRLFRHLSLPVQFVAGLGLLGGYFSFSTSGLQHGDARIYLSPPMWFLGLYETLTSFVMARVTAPLKEWQVGYETLAAQTYATYLPTFRSLAGIGLGALALACVAGAGLYLAGHLRHTSDLRQQATVAPGGRRHRRYLLRRIARRVIVRDPVAQASYFFTLQTLARSTRHKIYVAAYLAAGCLLAYFTLFPSIAKGAAQMAGPPQVPLLSIQFLIAGLLLVGLRGAFTIPVELRANWLFRLTAVGGEARLLAGVRRALITGLVPAFALSAGIHALAWDARTGLLHAGFGLLWALILMEALLVGLEKLPFTCPFVGGKANLKVRWPLYLAAYLMYVPGFATLERLALSTNRWSIVLALALTFTLLLQMACRRVRPTCRSGFVFEEAPDPATLSLGL